tara:strand:- start:198 stop:3674 length:3477 start_codon:yes stop_codon:yes gene_type:complete
MKQYNNITDIQNAINSINAEYYTPLQLDLLRNIYAYQNDILTPSVASRTKIETHLYSGLDWVTGNHEVTPVTRLPVFTDSDTNQPITFPQQPIGINLDDVIVNGLQLSLGKFEIAVNFFCNIIGSYNNPQLVIDEISPDRKELRLRSIDSSNANFLSDIAYYNSKVNHTDNTTSPQFFKTYLLNFSRNNTVVFVNSVVVNDFLYVKLLDALPTDIEIDFKCWVVEELKRPYIDTISIQEIVQPKTFNSLAGPNWYASDVNDISAGTGLKTWNSLLGSSVNTSQQIVDSYFSGSLSGIELNIDFRDFNNFVFYSSATERLENFRYKLELIEYYDSQSIALALISGSTATTNAADYTTSKTNLISGFDNFEKYLYHQSSSKLTTYDIAKIDATVSQLTGSYIDPAPKTNSTYPYTLYSVNSTEFKTWFNGIYESASLYDTLNNNALVKSIPEFIRLNEDNVDAETFVNMLGHHFDILYTYINHLTQINKREENPKLGMPDELLYSVAKQFGWNLQDGNQYQDLWQYVLGTDASGVPVTGSNSVGDPAVSGKKMTRTVWRRIVNNLPLLLKSKGTKRSVQALLSCYGIPQSMITIAEYGGPRIDRAPVYEKLNFDYSLDLIGNSAGTVEVNYSQSLKSVELRFRTDDVVKNPLLPNTMNLVTVGSNVVTLDFQSGTKGTIQINGIDSQPIEMFDGGWLSMLLREDAGTMEVVAKRSKYGKIVAAVSASDSAIFATDGTVIIGDNTGGSRLVGQVQELRLWSSVLDDSAFDNHVKAPAAYDANTDTYDELIFRTPLSQKINHTLTSSLSGAEPNTSTISSASFNGWSTDTPYDSIEETYYYDSISLGTGTFDDNKIRIESNELIGGLDVATRAERNQYDIAPLDSKKLGVYFSPQTMINEDIIAHFGFTSLDDYIGDPDDASKKEYPDLIQIAQSYWKKYTDKNDINSYIKIFTLFDLSFFKQLEQLLPARVDKLTGLLIQPNLLERSKDTILPGVSYSDLVLDVTLRNQQQPTASADYLNYIGSIGGNITTVTSSIDPGYQAYLTASNADKYNGVVYSHQYVFFSNGTWITGSSPYWLSNAVQPSIITSTYPWNDNQPTGTANSTYNGSSMSSPGFNINSTQTIDGGPVVEILSANPSQLIYQQPSQATGNFIFNTGNQYI